MDVVSPVELIFHCWNAIPAQYQPIQYQHNTNQCNTSAIPTNAIPVAGFHRSGSHVAVSLPLLLFYCRACLRIADSVFHSEFYTWRKSCRLHHWEMQFSESLNWLSYWFYSISKCRRSEIKGGPKDAFVFYLYFINVSLDQCDLVSPDKPIFFLQFCIFPQKSWKRNSLVLVYLDYVLQWQCIVCDTRIALHCALCIMQWAPAPLWHCWDAITRHELEPTQIIQLLWEAITELSLIRVLLTHCSPAFTPMITLWQQSLSNCDRRLVKKKVCKVIRSPGHLHQ